ncbi:MAG TPA: glycosyltransferase family A protein [Solirubrobacteraceae bacterium]|nr:glycosyltransferase family A protein [Solirubrobacteraceae bacterium]
MAASIVIEATELRPDIDAPLAEGAIVARTRPPTFSVVIPAYQAARTISRSITSVLAQTHPAAEVIVVDDGSTDGLGDALRPYGEKLKVLRQENRGAAAARNTGIRLSQGEFVALLDADDRFHPERLAALAALACRRPDLDLITTDTCFVGRDGRALGRFSEHNHFEVDDQSMAILRSCFLGGTPAVRTSRLLEVGGFDETLRTAEDWDCWIRLILTGSKAGQIRRPYYEYHLRGSGLTGDRLASLWDRVQVLEKASEAIDLDRVHQRTLRKSIRYHRQRATKAEIGAALASPLPRRTLIALASRRYPVRPSRGPIIAALLHVPFGGPWGAEDIPPDIRFGPDGKGASTGSGETPQLQEELEK